MSTPIDLLSDLTGPELVHVWNQVAEKKVKRFASREAALFRFRNMANRYPEVASKLNAVLQTRIQMFDAGGPIPSVDDIFTLVAEKESATLIKQIEKRRVRKPVAAVEAIEASKQGRVRVKGRAVLPKNAARVLAGEVLAGVVEAPPKPEDAQEVNSKLNFNYRRKERIKDIRPGTNREKLVTVMRSAGTTLPEVMKLLGLSYAQACYAIRDLHYTAGHGITMKAGRIYLADDL
jgi:hypothetical protein